MTDINVEQLQKDLAAAQEENKSLKEQLKQSLNDTKIQADARIADGERMQVLSDENDALKKEVATLLETPDAEEKKNGVGESFNYKDAENKALNGKYVILTAAIRIPGLGKRTALEILTDVKAQEWLVKNKSGVIKKMA